VFLGEDAEGNGAEVRELDLDGEKGRGGLPAGRVLAGVQLCLSVEDGGWHGLEGVRGRGVVVHSGGRIVARALEDGRDGRHGDWQAVVETDCNAGYLAQRSRFDVFLSVDVVTRLLLLSPADADRACALKRHTQRRVGPVGFEIRAY
jgi:hypothetical protein